jgi:hypothetical protein
VSNSSGKAATEVNKVKTSYDAVGNSGSKLTGVTSATNAMGGEATKASLDVAKQNIH